MSSDQSWSHFKECFEEKDESDWQGNVGGHGALPEQGCLGAKQAHEVSLRGASVYSSFQGGWSWTKEMIDTIHGWERRNFEVIGARNWETRDLAWSFMVPIRIVRQGRGFSVYGGVEMEFIFFGRLWKFTRKTNG